MQKLKLKVRLELYKCGGYMILVSWRAYGLFIDSFHLLPFLRNYDESREHNE